jgi:hypothetical protein
MNDALREGERYSADAVKLAGDCRVASCGVAMC